MGFHEVHFLAVVANIPDPMMAAWHCTVHDTGRNGIDFLSRDNETLDQYGLQIVFVVVFVAGITAVPAVPAVVAY